ncbi:hypothetical protein K438DRAFT_2111738, partial [Mycena galopus ATCC 62051]
VGRRRLGVSKKCYECPKHTKETGAAEARLGLSKNIQQMTAGAKDVQQKDQKKLCPLVLPDEWAHHHPRLEFSNVGGDHNLRVSQAQQLRRWRSRGMQVVENRDAADAVEHDGGSTSRSRSGRWFCSTAAARGGHDKDRGMHGRCIGGARGMACTAGLEARVRSAERTATQRGWAAQQRQWEQREREQRHAEEVETGMCKDWWTDAWRQGG